MLMKWGIAAAAVTLVVCLFALAQDVKRPGPSDVVLRVNDGEVTSAEFDELLKERKAREFMEELVDCLLVEQAAEKAGVTVSQDEIEERQTELLLQELSFYDNDVAKLRAELERYGYTIEERNKQNAQRTKFLLLAEKLVRKGLLQDENVKKLFETRYDKSQERVARAYHMFISKAEAERHIESRLAYLRLRAAVATDRQKEQIGKETAELRERLELWKDLNSRTVAEDMVRRLREGEDFEKLARRYGAGYTAEDYDMGWVSRKMVSEVLVPVIFEQLKPGEVAEPIQSKYGFHIVKLVEVKDISELKYEEVKPYLVDELSTRVVTKGELAELMAHLRSEAVIERLGLRDSGGSGR
jgi:parvulin-like peptidyl-prolyl isomerase